MPEGKSSVPPPQAPFAHSQNVGMATAQTNTSLPEAHSTDKESAGLKHSQSLLSGSADGLMEGFGLCKIKLLSEMGPSAELSQRPWNHSFHCRAGMHQQDSTDEIFISSYI